MAGLEEQVLLPADVRSDSDPNEGKVRVLKRAAANISGGAIEWPAHSAAGSTQTESIKTEIGCEHRTPAMPAWMLERLNDLGGDSVKTPHGTAYRTARRSATIADGDVFRKYVIDNQMFDLVDWRANAGAVDDFINDNGSQPPGVNYSVAYTVGVRRS